VRSSDYCPVTWRKSSRSNDGGYGDCVEDVGLGDEVALRDSKNPSGPVLTITRAEWRSFLGGIRAGEFG
jgi:hypothetical protein